MPRIVMRATEDRARRGVEIRPDSGRRPVVAPSRPSARPPGRPYQRVPLPHEMRVPRVTERVEVIKLPGSVIEPAKTGETKATQGDGSSKSSAGSKQASVAMSSSKSVGPAPTAQQAKAARFDDEQIDSQLVATAPSPPSRSSSMLPWLLAAGVGAYLLFVRK